MDLDLSIYVSTHVLPLFQHDHPAALNLCKWDLNRVASPFFWHGGLGTAVVLRGRKTPPTLSNGLLSINISNSLDISWFTLPQKYSINAAKGFSGVLHISGACSHCSHCHLSAVYPSTLLHIGLRAPPQRWAGQLHRPMSPPHPSPSRWARNKVFGCWKCQGSKASRVIQGWMITIWRYAMMTVIFIWSSWYLVSLNQITCSSW